ncbi:MAG: response regulator [Oligoflexia bacterium]|nr:response regulator [Oligoflexia bacterium]
MNNSNLTSKNFKALIVEDDRVALDYLSRFVKTEGFDVLVSENSENALSILKSEKIDLLITDYKLQQASGIELMKQAKKLLPNILTVLVTGYGDTNLAISAIQEGAFDYIKKPIDLQEMKVALGRVNEKIIEKHKLDIKPNIMIVDDEDDARNYISLFLKKELDGWNIFNANDGASAVELFTNQKIDIVLIDIKMPKMTGIVAISEMRKISTDFESIILTGHGDESDAIQAIRNGSMNFLKKPIDLEEVLVNVEKAQEKLKTNRTLQYRIRENEINNGIIAKITSDNKIIINTQQLLMENIGKFAEELMEALPLAILLVDNNFNINYMNSQTSRLLNNPNKVDQTFIEKLKPFGLEISAADLEKELANMTNNTGKDTGPIKKIKTGKYSYITLMQITLLGKDLQSNTAILMGIRGEH